jgi:hypothetical protein
MKLQVQDSTGSDEEIDDLPSSKTALVCKIAEIPPEMWITSFFLTAYPFQWFQLRHLM